MYRANKNIATDLNFEVDQLKQKLINYIYDSVELSKFKYELLQYDSELHQLTEKKFYVSVNFTGSNCLLVFAKINNKYNSFLVDRKTLSYNAQKVNLSTVKIQNINVKLDLDIYKGSIFDGILIQTKSEKIFVITDVYLFKGDKMAKSQLNSKLLTLRTYLKCNYDENAKDNNLIISVNKLYQLEEIDTLVNNVIPKMKNYVIKGICFYPEISGTKLIYFFGNETRQDINTNKNIIKNDTSRQNMQMNVKNMSNEKSKTQEISQILQKSVNTYTEEYKTVYMPKNNKDDTSYIFEMKKTNNIDVYQLNIVEPVIDGSITRLKRKKIGLAYVPTVSKSKWCSENIQNTDGKLLVHCKFHFDKYKWEPLLIANAKHPSMIEEFDVKNISDN